MRAFLEKIGGEWLDDFVYMSKEPLRNLGFEIVEFDGDDIENTLLCYPINIDKDVIIASVQASNEFFKAGGINPPTYIGYPIELENYLGRQVCEIFFSDIPDYDYPYFIKPSNDVKKFTGTVIENDFGLNILRDYDGVKDEDSVLLSNVINIVSEYRCFVHENELKGIQYYLGDFREYPDVSVIDNMILDYKSSNVAYTLDVGVTDKGETILIEVNDMWAIGSYGMNARIYALMCVRRMREIARNGKKNRI